MEIFSDGTERVRRVATEAHNVVVFCGNDPMINARETTDRMHLKLPDKQTRALDAVLELNQDAVLFLISGYPYQLDNERISTVMHILMPDHRSVRQLQKLYSGRYHPPDAVRSHGTVPLTNFAALRTTI